MPYSGYIRVDLWPALPPLLLLNYMWLKIRCFVSRNTNCSSCTSELHYNHKTRPRIKNVLSGTEKLEQLVLFTHFRLLNEHCSAKIRIQKWLPLMCKYIFIQSACSRSRWCGASWTGKSSGPFTESSLCKATRDSWGHGSEREPLDSFHLFSPLNWRRAEDQGQESDELHFIDNAQSF